MNFVTRIGKKKKIFLNSPLGTVSRVGHMQSSDLQQVAFGSALSAISPTLTSDISTLAPALSPPCHWPGGRLALAHPTSVPIMLSSVPSPLAKLPIPCRSASPQTRAWRAPHPTPLMWPEWWMPLSSTWTRMTQRQSCMCAKLQPSGGAPSTRMWWWTWWVTLACVLERGVRAP